MGYRMMLARRLGLVRHLAVFGILQVKIVRCSILSLNPAPPAIISTSCCSAA